MKNKGFTLIELLGVIIIIAILSMLIIPAITSVINKSRNSLHNDQIHNVEEAASRWSLDNADFFDSFHLNVIYIGLSDLKNGGYIAKGQTIDPLNKEDMDGCVQIIYNSDTKKYVYNYSEESCSTYSEKNPDNLGYAIYEYKDNTYKKVSDDHEIVSAGKYIYDYYLNHGGIKALGQEEDGLFETDKSYIFKGLNPNNNITFAGHTWSILSINKEDYSLIIARKGNTDEWNKDGSLVAFKESDLASKLADVTIESDKVVENDYLAGKIDGTPFSINAIASSLNQNKVKRQEDSSSESIIVDKTSLKIGTLSVVDYVNASNRAECIQNYMSDKCAENNFLKEIANGSSIWTLNDNGEKVWYIDSSGQLNTESPDKSKTYFIVASLAPNVYIKDKCNDTETNRCGSSNNKYVIE